eukprot:TRINITY_DN2042_c0_g1_i8.p1 TRINITY_DN2042_c0_g1~~TRINITY_DN2042_c0_g1_i8.p1  ORF type:complete len:222 (-),score=23.65 TRINITY_DN2042_c0_g1_i8:125-790(-)
MLKIIIENLINSLMQHQPKTKLPFFNYISFIKRFKSRNVAHQREAKASSFIDLPKSSYNSKNNYSAIFNTETKINSAYLPSLINIKPNNTSYINHLKSKYKRKYLDNPYARVLQKMGRSSVDSRNERTLSGVKAAACRHKVKLNVKRDEALYRSVVERVGKFGGGKKSGEYGLGERGRNSGRMVVLTKLFSNINCTKQSPLISPLDSDREAPWISLEPKFN